MNETNSHWFGVGAVFVSAYLMTNIPLAIISAGLCYRLGPKLVPMQQDRKVSSPQPSVSSSSTSSSQLPERTAAVDIKLSNSTSSSSLSQSSAKSSKSKSYWIDEIEKAAKNKNSEAIKTLLRESGIAGDLIQDRILGTKPQKDEGLIETLLLFSVENNVEITRDVLCRAIDLAAREGNLGVLEKLLAHGAGKIQYEDRRCAIYSAIRGGHSGVAKFLLENTQILTEDRRNIVLFGAKEGAAVDLVEALLHMDDAKASTELRREAIATAIHQSGFFHCTGVNKEIIEKHPKQLALVKGLLDGNTEIPRDAFLKSAMRYEDEELVRIVLEGAPKFSDKTIAYVRRVHVSDCAILEMLQDLCNKSTQT